MRVYACTIARRGETTYIRQKITRVTKRRFLPREGTQWTLIHSSGNSLAIPACITVRRKGFYCDAPLLSSSLSHSLSFPQVCLLLLLCLLGKGIFFSSLLSFCLSRSPLSLALSLLQLSRTSFASFRFEHSGDLYRERFI